MGKRETEVESQVTKNAEPRGEGVNEHVFWVTDNLLHDWVQLPDCRPEFIVAARQIKRVMTGNLNANVDTNPPFPGKERHFLRAQLARIFGTTALCPKGLFEMVDQEEEGAPQIAKFTEEYAMPSNEELKDLANWSNLMPIILKNGRCTHIKPENVDDDDAFDKIQAEDPT